MSLLIIFFFKQKTAYEMRISDWSSDVCSSDLQEQAEHQPPQAAVLHQRKGHDDGCGGGDGVGPEDEPGAFEGGSPDHQYGTDPIDRRRRAQQPYEFADPLVLIAVDRKSVV